MAFVPSPISWALEQGLWWEAGCTITLGTPPPFYLNICVLCLGALLVMLVLRESRVCGADQARGTIRFGV